MESLIEEIDKNIKLLTSVIDLLARLAKLRKNFYEWGAKLGILEKNKQCLIRN